LATAAVSGAPDDPSVQKEIEKESTDLQAMQQAEAQLGDPGGSQASRLLGSAWRLGSAGGLSARVRDALSDQHALQPLVPPLAVDPGIAAAFDIAKARCEYDIPVEMRPNVAQWIQFFQGSGRKYFRHYLARSTRYIPVMKDILRQEGLPEDTVFLAMIESGFSTLAYSWARASGPWQFIDATGRRFGLRVDFWLDERRDPVKSTRAAARYLRELHDEFGDWYLAWAGYNAGAGKIRKAINKYDTKDFWEMVDSGKVLRNETKNYVPKLIAAALVTKHPRQFGFSNDEIDWEKPIESEEVSVPDATDLQILAKAADCSLDDIKTLNPELRRWLTPPASAEKPYTLRVPKGHAETFALNYPKLAPKEHLVFQIHKVRRGDTLSKIAAQYHSFPEMVMRMNGLRNSKKLKLNTELMIPVVGEKRWASAQAAAPSAPRSGFVPAKPEEEVPAGTPTGPVLTGPIRRELIQGKERLSYGVQSGDNLWLISQKYNVTIEELKGWNELSGRKPKLHIGQQLIIYPRAPAPTSSPAPVARSQVAAAASPTTAGAMSAPASAPATPAPPPPSVPDQVVAQGNHRHIVHTISTGDSLWLLSQRYGVSVEDIKKWNRLSRRALLRPGSTLTVEIDDRQAKN
jgi:membrane-bound lytic murein transglycosylase D